MSREFIKSIDNQIRSFCESKGFKRDQFHWFNKPIQDGVFATLGFMKSHFGLAGHTFIGVTVGVSFQRINQIRNDLFELKKNANNNLIQTHICYLLPEGSNKQYWELIEGQDNNQVFTDLFSNIEEYAFPYQLEMSDLDHIFNLMKKDKTKSITRRDVDLPILYYLYGNHEAGLDIIERTIKKRVPDPLYLKFAENYLKLS